MKELSFYKEFYFYELKRKDEIESKINLPIIVISIIISIHVFIFSKNLIGNFKILAIGIASLNLVFIIIIVFFLVKSYSNFHRSYWYKELAEMNDLLKYENELEIEDHPNCLSFRNKYFIEELAECASINFRLNKERTESIAKAKQCMFIIILTTAFLSVSYIVTLV